MSNQTDDEKNGAIAIVFQDSQHENNSFFTINSHKAAEMLGVNRTRLSQLTSQGLFPYERRKVDARSRLFYRLNDLLNYQRKSSFGNLNAQQKNETRYLPVPVLTPSQSTEQKSVVPAAKVANQMRILNKNTVTHLPRTLQNALDLKRKKNEHVANTEIRAEIFELTKTMTQMACVITNLENEIAKLNHRTLSRKKSMFQRPRTKRTLKFVKRRNLK